MPRSTSSACGTESVWVAAESIFCPSSRLHGHGDIPASNLFEAGVSSTFVSTRFPEINSSYCVTFNHMDAKHSCTRPVKTVIDYNQMKKVKRVEWKQCSKYLYDQL